MTDHRIVLTGNLLTRDGFVREAGYSLQPPFVYNRDDIGTSRLRIKDWDYYLIQDEDYAVSLTFSDLGIIGIFCVCLIDYATRIPLTVTEVVPLPVGRLGMPVSSECGDIHWSNKRCSVDLTYPAAGVRRLSFAMRDFDKAPDGSKRDFECDVIMDQEPRDSMNIVRPWKEDRYAFYYNRKILGMRARGGFRSGEVFHQFEGDSSFGLLDWGRGVWTYENTWYWAEAQGHVSGHTLCLNLGYGFGDETIATENMVFFDGICHKLGTVDFGIRTDEWGSYIYTEPWHVRDDCGRLDLTYHALIDRKFFLDLGLAATHQHQFFGVCSGKVVLDDGSVIVVDDMRMSAEHIYNRY